MLKGRFKLTKIMNKVIEVALAPEKRFLELCREEREAQIELDLRDLKMYYGSWEELREVIKRLEDMDNEKSNERYFTND